MWVHIDRSQGLRWLVLAVVLVLGTAVQAGEKIQFSKKGGTPTAPTEKRALPGVDMRYTLSGRSTGIEGVGMPAPAEEKVTFSKRERDKMEREKNWMFQTSESSTNKIVLPNEKEQAEEEEERESLEGGKATSSVEKFLEERSKAKGTNEVARTGRNELKGSTMPNGLPLNVDDRRGAITANSFGPSDMNRPRMKMFESSRSSGNFGGSVTAGTSWSEQRGSFAGDITRERPRSLDWSRTQAASAPPTYGPGMNSGPGQRMGPGENTGAFGARLNAGRSLPGNSGFGPSFDASAPSSSIESKEPAQRESSRAVLEFPKRKF